MREHRAGRRLDKQLIKETPGVDPVQATRIADGDEHYTFHISQIIEPATQN